MDKERLKKFIKENLLKAKVYNPPAGRKDFVKLDLNEGYYFLNDEIINEMKNFDSFVVSSYPEYGELTMKVAQYAGRRPEEVCLTDGSDHALSMVINLLFKSGDEIIVPAPVFLMYFYWLELAEAKAIPIVYKEDNGVFKFPLGDILESITEKTKGVMLCNPNNPLGVSFADNEMIAILEKAKKFDIPVVVDEVYAEFSGYTAASLLDKFDNLIILRSFSKSFGLAGVRLGYALARENVINELVKLRMPWGVNHFAVYAGKIALNHLTHFKSKIKEANETKKELINFLNSKKVKCYDTDTNFIIAKFGDCQRVVGRLKEGNILISDISRYPHSAGLFEGAVRINIPSRNDFLRLKEVFEENQDLCGC